MTFLSLNFYEPFYWICFYDGHQMLKVFMQESYELEWSYSFNSFFFCLMFLKYEIADWFVNTIWTYRKKLNYRKKYFKISYKYTKTILILIHKWINLRKIIRPCFNLLNLKTNGKVKFTNFVYIKTTDFRVFFVSRPKDYIFCLWIIILIFFFFSFFHISKHNRMCHCI